MTEASNPTTAVRTRTARRLVAVAVVCSAAIPLHVVLNRSIGHAMLAAGLALAAYVYRRLATHSAVISASLVVISTISPGLTSATRASSGSPSCSPPPS